VTLTDTYSFDLASLTFTIPPGANRNTVGFFQWAAYPTNSTIVSLTIGVFVNGVLQSSIVGEDLGAEIRAGMDMRGTVLAPGTYTVSMRVKTTFAGQTKSGNQFVVRIAVV
jgi:hypothetical protein